MNHAPVRLRTMAAIAIALIWFMMAHATGQEVASIVPAKGLVLTSTVHSTFVVGDEHGTRSYADTDAEEWDSVADANADVIDYQIRVSAPSTAGAYTDLSKFVLHRRVLRQDIARAARINLFYSSQDPEQFAGQTFLETSTQALGELKSGAAVSYVIGVIDGEDPMGAFGTLIRQAAANSVGKTGNTPMVGMLSVLGTPTAHTYYRGILRRVETTPVLLPVLLNGVRTSLPALHAQGTIVNGGKSFQVQFWWLDSPVWPLALKWVMSAHGHTASQQITKIDRPRAQTSNAESGAGNQTATMVHALSTSCRLELSGIYFNTGSALLRPESRTALQQIAQAVVQARMPRLEVQGHTDNIGPAQLNQQLSLRRADAVRQALVVQFGVPAGQLVAVGFGATRPMETNDTVAGRARNRRVELACPGAH